MLSVEFWSNQNRQYHYGDLIDNISGKHYEKNDKYMKKKTMICLWRIRNSNNSCGLLIKFNVMLFDNSKFFWDYMSLNIPVIVIPVPQCVTEPQIRVLLLSWYFEKQLILVGSWHLKILLILLILYISIKFFAPNLTALTLSRFEYSLSDFIWVCSFPPPDYWT